MTDIFIDKVLSKNHICFEKNGNYYYTNITGDLITDIFKRNLMNIYLERYEQDRNIVVNYDDIITISSYENHDTIIQDLPNKLRRLTVMNSTCTSIVLNEHNKQTIELIHVDKTNINTLLDISECPRLIALQINHSNISAFDTPLPDSLKELNLCGNVLTNANFNFAHITKQIEKHADNKKNTIRQPFSGFRLNLNDNYFNHDLIPENIQKKYLFLRQGTYKHHPITFRNVHAENIRNQVFENRNGTETIRNVLSNNRQTVHLSSINKSIEKSYLILQDYLKTKKFNVCKLTKDFLPQFQVIKKMQDCLKRNGHEQQEFELFCNLNSDIYSFIQVQFDLSTVHSITGKTYKEIFELIWTIIIHHPLKDDLLVRLKDELTDSRGMCFTGCINRLFNTLVGFIDGVKVSISYKEEIQMSIQMILAKMNKFIEENKHQDMNNENEKERIHKQLQEFMYETDSLFCDIPKDIIESEKITPEYGQSWTDTMIELYEETFEKYIIERNNKKYEILWNDDIIETEHNGDSTIVGVKHENNYSFF